MVKYDTVIKIPSGEELRPGMSAEIEIVLAEHKDVLTIPVAAVVETADGHACWVQANGDVERRDVKLGDSNDVFMVVESGLQAGEKVVLNPLAYVEQAQDEALRSLDQLDTFPDEDSDDASTESVTEEPEIEGAA